MSFAWECEEGTGTSFLGWEAKCASIHACMVTSYSLCQVQAGGQYLPWTWKSPPEARPSPPHPLELWPVFPQVLFAPKWALSLPLPIHFCHCCWFPRAVWLKTDGCGLLLWSVRMAFLKGLWVILATKIWCFWSLKYQMIREKSLYCVCVCVCFQKKNESKEENTAPFSSPPFQQTPGVPSLPASLLLSF